MVQHTFKPNTNCTIIVRFAVIFFSGFIVSCLFFSKAMAQNCPPNIDFETGTFDNWTCYTGSVAAIAGQNVITLSPAGGPVPEQHTMFTANQGNGVDFFGGFPVNCPNGSGHSIRLGNSTGGGRAEGISYEFTIPANQNTFSLVYHYAVVFQDPNHQEFQQPRLVIEATNVTDDEVISCSSFTFFPNGSLLPGFFISPYKQDTTSVWCKNWSAVTMNLNGNAGKTIRLFFKTADCTFNRHFGYAYIDVNSECNSQFVGAAYCPDDAFATVTAPYGYQNYTWFGDNFTQILGTQQSITFTPPPLPGTNIAVEVVPYNGYGCKDTLFAVLVDTLTITSNAGKDITSCNQTPVTIGANPKPGLLYSWTPTDGLSNPSIANPTATPALTTTYTLTTRNLGGGCANSDEVIVTAAVIDTSIVLLGKAAFCTTSSDSAVLVVKPTFQIQWYKDGVLISGATQTKFKVTESGAYYATVNNNKGCILNTATKNILIESPREGIAYEVKNAVEYIPIPLEARNFGATVLWTPATFLSNPQSFTPTFKGISERLYSIAITTIAGCTTFDTQLVKVFKEINIYVPSIFTPNKDGFNDYLKPIPAGIKEFKYFKVYNRWGKLLFDLSSNPLGWDGFYKGVPQSLQTVVWVAEGVGFDNKVYRQKGTCILAR
jgi:gliding motility-associated-like protein